MKIPSVEAELFRTDGQENVRADRYGEANSHF